MADKKVILTIDDDTMVLRVITTLLSSTFDLRIAKSAADALYILAQLTPDLILLDIEMPDISGFEFLHTIKKNPKFMATPVVIVSGHSEKEFAEHAEKMGASCLVPKPIDKDVLREKINYALENPKKSIMNLL